MEIKEVKQEWNTVLKTIVSALLGVVAYFLIQLHGELKKTSENLKDTTTAIQLQGKDIQSIDKRVERLEKKAKINE